MILEALWGMVTGIVSGVLSLLPTWRVDTTELTDLAGRAGALASLGDGYFPVTLMLGCLAVLLGIKVALVAWHLVLFVYSLIPLKAT